MRPPVIALLGPTNTGKTYLALERMLEHATGMIGFPLRLLARENYDRVVRAKGVDAVALITGEERILPRSPSYYVCTVEAMPLHRAVDFLAVDEVQLAADRDRGYIFTDRILHARGRAETMLLGAETIRPLLRLLVPEAAFIARPRLSTLTHAAPRKLRHLPRRAAVVAFSLAGVYEIAEELRRQAGGASLVFGALSPRTRNAQVALYQAGEVDYLVATDAIGMGLNLDIDHVVFTALTKFDGQGPRALRPAEVAQIAGRAGRHLRDGTFGPTEELGPFPPGLAESVEGHQFEPLTALYWRNSDLSFASIGALLDGLERRPERPQLIRMRHGDDHRALAALARDPEVTRLARDEEAVRLLWEVCQVPDFQSGLSDAHTGLLSWIFRHLAGPERRLPEDWVAAHLESLDRVDGGTEVLLGRLAGIRTWTYVSHRGSWLHDSAHWRERTRAVEDRLSDALHERLTEQFVDRRGTILARYDSEELLAEITDSGEVLVQGLRAGRLEGFRFLPDASARDGSRGLLAAANRTLREEIGARVARLAAAPDEDFALTAGGQVLWRSTPVARLVRTHDVLAPRVDLLTTELLDVPRREQARRRLAAWLQAHLRAHLSPLPADPNQAPAVRGLLFTLASNLGSLPRRALSARLNDLGAEERRALVRAGVTLGRLSVFWPGLLKPAAIRLRGLLFCLHGGLPRFPAPSGRPSVSRDHDVPTDFYAACGYAAVGPRAVRVDVLERVLTVAERRAPRGEGKGASWKGASTPKELAALLGCAAEEVPDLLRELGFVEGADGRRVFRPGREPRRRVRAGEALALATEARPNGIGGQERNKPRPPRRG